MQSGQGIDRWGGGAMTGRSVKGITATKPFTKQVSATPNSGVLSPLNGFMTVSSFPCTRVDLGTEGRTVMDFHVERSGEEVVLRLRHPLPHRRAQ